MDGPDFLTHASRLIGRHPRRIGERRAIVVLGMDRSGTSLTTHILHTLGATLPRDLIGPAHGNPLGHWEPRRLVNINDEILSQFGRRWDDPRPLPDQWHTTSKARFHLQRIIAEIQRTYADASLLVIKDPRLCRLLPLYEEALDCLNIRPVVILQVRPVAEVVRSLMDRDNLPPGLSELLWLRSVTQAEWASRQYPRIWVSFGQMIDDWRSSIDRIGNRLELTWPIQPDDVAEHIRFRVNLRQPQGIAPVMSTGVLAGAWDAIQAGLADDESAARAGFDHVQALLRDMDQLYSPAMSHHLYQLEAELKAMRESTCWRLTAPLRALKHAATQALRV